jgi:hypothetical protein
VDVRERIRAEVTTIEEFIEARIAERETSANEAIRLEAILSDRTRLEYEWVRLRRSPSGQVVSSMFVAGAPAPAEVLRQCAASRALVESAGGCSWCDTFDDERKAMLKTTAAIWSDHPDYQEEWAI